MLLLFNNYFRNIGLVRNAVFSKTNEYDSKKQDITVGSLTGFNMKGISPLMEFNLAHHVVLLHVMAL